MMVGKMDLEEALLCAQQGSDFTPENLDWMRALIGGLMGYPALWDEKFAPYLSMNWPMERLSVTDKTILRMACFELWKLPTVPPKVTISEYVALAKIYGSSDSGKFVNGVLASVLKESPKAEWDPSQQTVHVPLNLEPDAAEEAEIEIETVVDARPGWTLKSEE